ncbi:MULTISPECIES: amino acid ABC transporter permease [unclassified Aminobacter]|jgi:His/Glu/Gln/Arg/opine family amino acid ABC transporter permease subunit|uniref:amino acid ABC transporter permease n=1 Tax=unclassified Aminobacter TaxID=2644704 RepID=UPI000466F097|nr:MULTISPECIES: amino acid ABC transporter permease [unclassified Aminobacter]TWG60589.1 amino acid ABC transporter membrane protein (PAAT family) [Aminobacter sp. J44]TWH30324.1 amino acid ABC transporter membrane protein (PAAT family) [Aminobacter sp. J15]
MIEFAIQYLPLYLQGALVGLGLTAAAMAGALVIGVLVAIGRLSSNPVLKYLTLAYVAVFRAVPPLVLLYIVYFGIPAWAMASESPALIALFSPLDNRFIAATLALAVNAGAYVAEIIRASILSLPADQMEAARSIGMTYPKAMRRIILPQAFRIAFPPLCSEFIIILKGTSLASVIGVTELMRNAQMIASSTFRNLDAYVLAALVYVVLVIVLQFITVKIEARMNRAMGIRSGR